jgi:uncharacterized membrane protein YbhN (UPF0104 family)
VARVRWNNKARGGGSEFPAAGEGSRLLAAGRAALGRPWLRWLLVAAVLAAILAKLDRALLVRHLAGFDPVCGAAMVAVFLGVLLLFAVRWWLIARALGFRAPFGRFVRIVWISAGVGEFGPPLVVGELARFQLMREHGDAWLLAASQAIDRLSGKLALLVLVGVLLPFYLGVYRDSPLYRIGAFVLILAVAVGIAVVLIRRFWPLAKVQSGLVAAVCNPLAAPAHYGLSLLIQTLLAFNLALAAWGFGGDGRTVWLLGPLLLMGVSSLPGLVSDWGKREAVAVLLLAPAGLDPERSLAVSLIYGALHSVAAAPGVLLWVGLRRRRAG